VSLTGQAYTYANDSPLNFVDPSGLGIWEFLGAIGGFLYQNSETFSFIFSILGYASTVAAITIPFFATVTSVLEGISAAFSILAGIRAMLTGQPWWKILIAFGGTLATAARAIKLIITRLPGLINALTEGQGLLSSLSGLGTDLLGQLGSAADALAGLAAKAYSFSTQLGGLLATVDDMLYVLSMVPPEPLDPGVPAFDPGPAPATCP
jgi:hypothetical protein